CGPSRWFSNDPKMKRMILLASRCFPLQVKARQGSLRSSSLNEVRSMNAEEDSMGGKQGPSIRQATIVLPYFDEEVPVLYLADGTAYLPVRSLCRILGLRAETQ